MQSVYLPKVVSGALAERPRVVPSQKLFASEVNKKPLQFRSDMFWSSEKGVAFGDGNRAEFPSPGVRILKQKMMD